MTRHGRANEPEDLARLFVERANAGDAAGLADLYEPDAVLGFPPGQQVAADHRPPRAAPVSDPASGQTPHLAAGLVGLADLSRLDPHIRPEIDRCALITIDTQVDFLEGGSSPLRGTGQVLPAIGCLVEAFRSAGRPIIHVIRLYAGTDVDLVRRTLIESGAPIVRPGSPGSQLAAELRPPGSAELDTRRLLGGDLQWFGPTEAVIWKPRWSAFYRTPLHDHLTSLKANTLIVAGLNYPNCPRATIADASAYDYRVIVAADAISGVMDLHLDEAVRIGAIPMASTAVAALLRGAPSHPGGIANQRRAPVAVPRPSTDTQP